jgi:hypothetical protein
MTMGYVTALGRSVAVVSLTTTASVPLRASVPMAAVHLQVHPDEQDPEDDPEGVLTEPFHDSTLPGSSD